MVEVVLLSVVAGEEAERERAVENVLLDAPAARLAGVVIAGENLDVVEARLEAAAPALFAAVRRVVREVAESEVELRAGGRDCVDACIRLRSGAVVARGRERETRLERCRRRLVLGRPDDERCSSER